NEREQHPAELIETLSADRRKGVDQRWRRDNGRIAKIGGKSVDIACRRSKGDEPNRQREQMKPRPQGTWIFPALQQPAASDQCHQPSETAEDRAFGKNHRRW